MEDLNKKTVSQLKIECANRGLETSGKKADLVERLNDSIQEAEENGEETEVKDEGNDEPVDNAEEENEDGDAQDEEMQVVDTAEGDEDDDVEDNADDVIGAIDSFMDEDIGKKEEEEEEEEDDDDNQEVTDHANDKDDEEKKTEDKKEKDTPKKPGRVKIPIKKVVRAEFQREIRMRTVVFGPLNLEDLKAEEMLEFLKKAEQFFIRFATDGKTGHCQLRMKTYEQAKDMVEAMTAAPFKEGLVIKQLGPEDGVNVDNILRGETEKPIPEKIDLRMLYVHNVPESATEEALKTLVPEAVSACIPKDQDRKPKGYAFLEFESEAKMDEIYKKVSNLTLDENTLTLHQIPNIDYSRKNNRSGNRGYGGGQRGGNNRQNRQDNRGNRDRGRQSYGGGSGRNQGGGGGGNRNQGGNRNHGGNRNQGGRNWNSSSNVRPLLGGSQQSSGNWGGNSGNQGGSGGVDAMNLLVGLSQMLSQQQGGGNNNQGYRSGNQGYNDGGAYGGGWQGGNQGNQDSWNRKRRGGDDYSGNYGGKRFNKGGRGRRF